MPDSVVTDNSFRSVTGCRVSKLVSGSTDYDKEYPAISIADIMCRSIYTIPVQSYGKGRHFWYGDQYVGTYTGICVRVFFADCNIATDCKKDIFYFSGDLYKGRFYNNSYRKKTTIRTGLRGTCILDCVFYISGECIDWQKRKAGHCRNRSYGRIVWQFLICNYVSKITAKKKFLVLSLPYDFIILHHDRSGTPFGHYIACSLLYTE